MSESSSAPPGALAPSLATVSKSCTILRRATICSSTVTHTVATRRALAEAPPSEASLSSARRADCSADATASSASRGGACRKCAKNSSSLAARERSESQLTTEGPRRSAAHRV